MGRKPSKSTGKGKKENTPIEKDDGSRWKVCTAEGQPIYLVTGGLTRAQADRLAFALAAQPVFVEPI